MTSLQHTSKKLSRLVKAEQDVVVRYIHPNHFHCFCYKLYYFSNFKDFNTVAPAC